MQRDNFLFSDECILLGVLRSFPNPAGISQPSRSFPNPAGITCLKLTTETQEQGVKYV